MNQVITLLMSPSEANLVIAALAELPYKTSAALIHRFAADTNRQLQPPPEDTDIPLAVED